MIAYIKIQPTVEELETYNSWKTLKLLKINLTVGELKKINNKICTPNNFQCRKLKTGAQVFGLGYKAGTI